MSAHVFVADVERFVDDDPRDRLLTPWLREGSVVCDVVIGLGQQRVHGKMADVDTVTFMTSSSTSSQINRKKQSDDKMFMGLWQKQAATAAEVRCGGEGAVWRQ